MTRLRDLRRREFAPLPESERAGVLFAQRLARELCAQPTVTPAEWFTAYRVIVPRSSGGNGRAGPRLLEEGWRARRLRGQGKTHGEIAMHFGWLTADDIALAKEERTRTRAGTAYIARVESAKRRVERIEAALVACEQRIGDARHQIPSWLTAA